MKRHFQPARTQKSARGFVFGLLVLGLNVVPIWGATYYVNPEGSDTNSGTQQAPWKSVAKVNATPLQPGDEVLFRRAGNWRESLVVPTNGAVGKPITFADYGTGKKPQFWGSDVLSNAAFVPAGKGVYRYAMIQAVGALLADHQFVFDAAKGEADWWEWKEGALLLHTRQDPRTSGRIYTACAREDVLNSNGHDHLVFRNLSILESAKPDGGYGVRIMNSSDVQVLGCEVRHAGKHHFASINSTGVVFRDCLAAYAMPHQAHGGTSAYVAFGDDKTRPKQSVEFDNCSFENTADAWDGVNNAYCFITHGAAIGSITIKGMISRGAGWELDNRESEAQIMVRGGWLENNRLEIYGRGILVDGLRLTGAAATIDVTASNCMLQNVTIIGTNLGSVWYQTAVLSRGANNTVRNSRIELSPDAPEYNTPLAVAEQGTGLSYFNNTLVSHGDELKNWTNSAQVLAAAHGNVHLRP